VGRELCADVIRIRSLLVVRKWQEAQASTGRRIGPLQRPCGSPRIAPRRARRTAESDSGDPLARWTAIFQPRTVMALRAIRAHVPLVNVRVGTLQQFLPTSVNTGLKWHCVH